MLSVVLFSRTMVQESSEPGFAEYSQLVSPSVQLRMVTLTNLL